MSFWINACADQSFSLYIEGDLQFDSRDESVYHECLVLPAIALAEARFTDNLSVLICGGGDGLATREVLKSRSVSNVSLVDCDREIVEFAKTNLAEINANSFADRRVTVEIQDAWEFLESESKSFHVIISDLTEIKDYTDTKMHSVEWYQMVRDHLVPGGVAAINIISPSAQPTVYWSILNSMRFAGLDVRPYRIALSSFTRHGYGPDWGFALASDISIGRSHLTGINLPQPRRSLSDSDSLCRLFSFPSWSAEKRFSARPVRCVDDVFERWDSTNIVQSDLSNWDALDWQAMLDEIPSPGCPIVPDALQDLLVERDIDDASLRARFMSIITAEYGTKAAFAIDRLLQFPREFLSAIQFPDLLNKLLARAAELPQIIVTELENLRQKLADNDFAFDLSARALAIIAIVVILSNLASPETAFGKGSAACAGGHSGGHSSAHASSSHSGHASVTHGAFNFGGHSLTTSSSQSDRRQNGGSLPTTAPTNLNSSGLSNFHSTPHLLSFGGLSGGLQRQLAGASGFRQALPGSQLCTNRYGAIMPARKFFCYSSEQYLKCTTTGLYDSQLLNDRPTCLFANYELTRDSFILPDGRLALMLDHRTAALLGDHSSLIIDVHNGHPMLQIAIDEKDKQILSAEINGQIDALNKGKKAEQSWKDWETSLNLKGAADDNTEEEAALATTAELLTNANLKLETCAIAPSSESTRSADDFRLLPGVRVSSDGKCALVSLPDGTTAYVTGKNWFKDKDLRQQCDHPYPVEFGKFLKTYLKHELKSADALDAQRRRHLSDLQAHIENLRNEKTDYKNQLDSSVMTAATGASDDRKDDKKADASLPQSLQNKDGSSGATAGTEQTSEQKVKYGSGLVPKSEALSLTEREIASTEKSIDLINSELNSRSERQAAFTKLLHNLSGKE
ncbi:unnamed protein product [Sphagnum balticum]